MDDFAAAPYDLTMFGSPRKRC